MGPSSPHTSQRRPTDRRGTSAGVALLTRRSAIPRVLRGTRREFDLPLRPAGTDFQRRVWDVLATIPWGTTTTYGAIAARLGLPPGASRAVGAANGANPIAIVLPCHRVIGSDGRLTGYAGGLERKALLLHLEGVATQADQNAFSEHDRVKFRSGSTSSWGSVGRHALPPNGPSTPPGGEPPPGLGTIAQGRHVVQGELGSAAMSKPPRRAACTTRSRRRRLRQHARAVEHLLLAPTAPRTSSSTEIEASSSRDTRRAICWPR